MNKRIEIIDGFRALAILSVLFYHFFSRWDDKNYSYLPLDVFHYGFKGVSFFFIISGFVISYTLENTQYFIEFWKKRFIRLFPSMLVASTVTYLFIIIFDSSNLFLNSHYFRNYLISLTFLLPNIFDFFFSKKIHFSYLNYSYWSLWPEIQFYLLASVLYFTNKKYFLFNFLIVSIIIIIGNDLFSFYHLNKNKIIEKIINLFNLISYLKYFIAGVLFYEIYKKSKITLKKTTSIITLIFIYLSLIFPFKLENFISTTLMFLLFLIFILRPESFNFLKRSFFVNLGISSYFLYLIHEYIGVLIIKKTVSLFYPYSFIAPILMIVIFIFSSIFYFKFIEKKISKFISTKIIK